MISKSEHAAICLGPQKKTDTPVPETAVSPKSEAVETVERMRDALRIAQRAMNAWTVAHAGDMCSKVDRGWLRAELKGGTLAYIADVQAAIDAALNPGEPS